MDGPVRCVLVDLDVTLAALVCCIERPTRCQWCFPGHPPTDDAAREANTVLDNWNIGVEVTRSQLLHPALNAGIASACGATMMKGLTGASLQMS